MRTDRLQDEDSLEYRSGLRNDANLLTVNDIGAWSDQSNGRQ